MPRMANESGMNKRQIAEFQARLEGWLAELRVAAGQVTREGCELVDESALDVADRAVNSATKEFLFRQAHDRHRMSHLVETALDRIRDGNFGECLACGGLIGLKRLEAVPWTKYCVACQNELERGELSGVDISVNDVPSPEFRFRTRNRSTVCILRTKSIRFRGDVDHDSGLNPISVPG
jgi:DnaK suppressor protein